MTKDIFLTNNLSNKKEKFFFSSLGEEIGLLFQFADDFLDVKCSKKLATI